MIGGTLFIGRALVKELVKAGHEVAVLHRKARHDLGKKVASITADRNDPDLGIISIRHPAGAALLGAQEDEEIEFEMDNKPRQWMVIKIEKSQATARV